MKIKTAELTGNALNYAVATLVCPKGYIVTMQNGTLRFFQHHEKPYKASYSDPVDFVENWAQGGPIIEREGIRIRPDHGWSAAVYWPDGRSVWYEGPTLLIAAMRCYVASKLGDEVEVPDEFL